MADEKELKIEDKDKDKDKDKGHKKIIIIAVILVVLLAGAGGAFFFLSSEGGQEDAAEVAKPAVMNAYYVAMPRPFVFNIIGIKRERLVQIKVQLMVRGEDNESLAKANIPLIESTLLQVFSATTEQQLSTFEGKERARSDSYDSVVEILTKYTGKGVIEKILFSGFVMQ